MLSPEQHMKVAQLLMYAATFFQTEMPLLLHSPKGNHAARTRQKYMLFRLMEQAGFKHKQIAHVFVLKRHSVTKALGKLDIWLAAYPEDRAMYDSLQKGAPV
jgi:hypothetical protein